MKKILSVVLAAVMFLSCSAMTFATNSKSGNLKFDENGEFKILLLADVQDGDPISPSLIAYMNEALDATQPDLVIFLGDNIMTPGDGTEASYWSSYDDVLKPITSRNIPFTLVFGNHDDESMETITKEEMLEKYMSYDGCLAYDADVSLHGCGTHNLEILSSDGSHTAFNLWMMDSGDYCYAEEGTKHYDCVRKDQIAWYEDISEQLEKENGGSVPSFMFQHIVPQEVTQAVMCKLPFQLGAITKNFADGTSSTYLPNFGNYTGFVFESPCPSLDNDGQWDAISQRGDVNAMFFGHDHVNSYKTTVDGVDALNVPGATYQSYSSYMEQGGMLVTLDEDDLSTYETELIYSNDLAVKDGSALPGLDRTLADYRFSRICRIVLYAFSNIVRNAVQMIFG